ncbi:MAG: translocation/assembly module TamB domain-containing protein, partial [Gammaproteobacteria bacterium]|nr:translocation/assembly module TamB domain-containing protein [Gammaproteobacteria bacterium]
NGLIDFGLLDGVPQGSLQLTELSGEFGDYPFQGQGQIRYADQALRFDNVQLSTAANQLTVNGALADELDFNWQVSAPQLNQFIEQLGGELQASGQVTGTLADMRLVADIAAESVNYNGVFVDDLRVNLQRLGQTIGGSIELTDGGFRGEDRTDRIQSLTILVDGTETQHQIALAATTDYGSIDLNLQGGFADFADMSWNGILREGLLDSGIGQWRTESASSLTLDPSSISLSNNCWRQNSAVICLQVAGENPPEGLSLRVGGQLSDYPLAVLNHPDFQPDSAGPQLTLIPQLPEMVGVAGNVNADLTFTMESNGSTSAILNLQPNDVLLTVRSTEREPDEEMEPESSATGYSEQSYALNNPQLTVSLDNGSWDLQAATGLSGASSGNEESLSGSLDSQVQLLADGELTGNLQADLGDIGWLAAFTQDVENLKGTLSGGVSLFGTIDEPQFAVDLDLANGQVTVPPLGITVEQITSSISSLDDGSIQLTTSAMSGSGTLELQGQLADPFSTQRSLQAQISGTDFRLAEIPDLNLTVTPDITVTADEKRIGMTGSLLLPTLVINLVELPEQAVDVSRDAVIISFPADHPELERSIAAEQGTLFNIPIVADVDISLGDQVSFNGFGLTTDVAGNLNVRQQENGTNLTYGELEIVSGQYTLYGRSLQIRQGKLLFFGAYDNPALDIRATRQVEAATVGVLMNGSLKNIQRQLFSTPALPESDIIAIMITGKPFSEIGQQEGNSVVGAIANLGLSRSQGLTNQVREQLGLDTLAITNTGNINNSILTIGKYLTPDLFIRYGIGLFDHQSKLAVDYTLTERFTLQAETGEYQSVDLIYRLER